MNSRTKVWTKRMRKEVLMRMRKWRTMRRTRRTRMRATKVTTNFLSILNETKNPPTKTRKPQQQNHSKKTFTA